MLKQLVFAAILATMVAMTTSSTISRHKRGAQMNNEMKPMKTADDKQEMKGQGDEKKSNDKSGDDKKEEMMKNNNNSDMTTMMEDGEGMEDDCMMYDDDEMMNKDQEGDDGYGEMDDDCDENYSNNDDDMDCQCKNTRCKKGKWNKKWGCKMNNYNEKKCKWDSDDESREEYTKEEIWMCRVKEDYSDEGESKNQKKWCRRLV